MNEQTKQTTPSGPTLSQLYQEQMRAIRMRNQALDSGKPAQAALFTDQIADLGLGALRPQNDAGAR
jgi:hypothetical protein